MVNYAPGSRQFLLRISLYFGIFGFSVAALLLAWFYQAGNNELPRSVLQMFGWPAADICFYLLSDAPFNFQSAKSFDVMYVAFVTIQWSIVGLVVGLVAIVSRRSPRETRKEKE